MERWLCPPAEYWLVCRFVQQMALLKLPGQGRGHSTGFPRNALRQPLSRPGLFFSLGGGGSAFRDQSQAGAPEESQPPCAFPRPGQVGLFQLGPWVWPWQHALLVQVHACASWCWVHHTGAWVKHVAAQSRLNFFFRQDFVPGLQIAPCAPHAHEGRPLSCPDLPLAQGATGVYTTKTQPVS